MELYVHIPFCVKKCRYCSFASYAAKENEYAPYIDLLLKESAARASEAVEPIRTVYIGGGTPSLLSPDLFVRLAAGLEKSYGFSQVTEFSSEANPGTITPEWLRAAVSSGVNRLSIGMQAYQDRHLKLLGRIHSYTEVCSSVHDARNAGIDNISLDLIFGIPGQSIREWEETLDAALALCPDHISAYGLIPEEKTPLFDDLSSGFINLPDPDEEREMYSLAVSRLACHGLLQYEISNFAKPGRECSHNIGYWKQIPYIGLGLSAASMVRMSKGIDGISYIRRTNPSSFEEYSEMIRFSGADIPTETISGGEARFETMMLGLRMNEGVSETDFFHMHGVAMESCYGGKLSSLEKRGLLTHENGRWKLTARGFDIQNSILVELMDD